MTAQEKTLIEKLRDELHGYHVAVETLTERCQLCREQVLEQLARLAVDVYGVEGKREQCPGLIGQVMDLIKSRRIARLAMYGAWILLTILVGAVVTAAAKTLFQA